MIWWLLGGVVVVIFVGGMVAGAWLCFGRYIGNYDDGCG